MRQDDSSCSALLSMSIESAADLAGMQQVGRVVALTVAERKGSDPHRHDQSGTRLGVLRLHPDARRRSPVNAYGSGAQPAHVNDEIG